MNRMRYISRDERDSGSAISDREDITQILIAVFECLAKYPQGLDTGLECPLLESSEKFDRCSSILQVIAHRSYGDQEPTASLVPESFLIEIIGLSMVSWSIW